MTGHECATVFYTGHAFKFGFEKIAESAGDGSNAAIMTKQYV